MLRAAEASRSSANQGSFAEPQDDTIVRSRVMLRAAEASRCLQNHRQKAHLLPRDAPFGFLGAYGARFLEKNAKFVSQI